MPASHFTLLIRHFFSVGHPVRRLLVLAWFALVAIVLVTLGRELDWGAAMLALQALPATVLLLAVCFAALNHVFCSAFDLVALRYVGAPIGAGRAMLAGFISHAGNLNVGPLLGAIGLRQRLYSRLGLRTGVIAAVTGLSMVTNWLGFFLVSATVVMFRGSELLPEDFMPGDSASGDHELRAAGALVWLVALAWFVLCARAAGRSFDLGHWRIPVPPLSLALQQAGLAVLNWLSAAAIVHVLLGGQVDYPLVLVAVMLAAIATMVTNIPSGIGVVEASFFWVLGDRVDAAPLLAALVAYRMVYFILPLGVAGVLWYRLERRLTRESYHER